MTKFDFGSVVTAKSTSSSKRLRAYEIHQVKLESVKIDELEIKNGERAGEKAKVLKTRFSNDNGYYEETIWFPTSDLDVKRKENQWGGFQPSNFDKALMFVVHVLGIINPERLVELRELCQTGKIKTFDQYAAAYTKFANEKIGAETALKLVGYQNKDGNMQPSLPFFCFIDKEGEARIKENFLGEYSKLSFTASEQQSKNKFDNTKPTVMSDSTSAESLIENNTPDTSSSANVDVDADELNAFLNDL